MTLLVGVRCPDAVVLAADGVATYGNMVGHTVKQPVRKICIVAPNAAIATSGPVGLGQRLAGELGKQELLATVDAMEGWQAMSFIRLKFAEHLIQELSIAANAAKALGQPALQNAVSYTLVALRLGGKPHLFQFDPQGAPEEATALPWVTLGSGQSTADAFLSFLRRIFWPDRHPSLQEAIFTALWTVLQGIEAAPGHIGGKPQVIVLKSEGEARELTEADLMEHHESIRAAETALADFRTSLGSATGPTIPPAP